MTPQRTFRYGPNSITVFVHPDRATMMRKGDPENDLGRSPHVGKAVQAIYNRSSKKTRRGGARGDIHLYRGATRLDYVSHEVVHAVWHISDNHAGSVCKADEEAAAYALGNLLYRIWKWLLKLGPKEES